MRFTLDWKKEKKRNTIVQDRRKKRRVETKRGGVNWIGCFVPLDGNVGPARRLCLVACLNETRSKRDTFAQLFSPRSEKTSFSRPRIIIVIIVIITMDVKGKIYIYIYIYNWNKGDARREGSVYLRGEFLLTAGVDGRTSERTNVSFIIIVSVKRLKEIEVRAHARTRGEIVGKSLSQIVAGLHR